MEITLEEIQKKFESLPEEVKWAIMAINVDDKIIEIGQTNNLNVEQMGQLSLETYMVMLGFVKPEKFEESLKNSLQLPDEKIRAVGNLVNEKILKGIRSKMMESSTEDSTEKENITQEHEIMKSAGIEILSEEKNMPVPEKLEITGEVKPQPIFAQKLSTPVQSQTIKTEHTLENISKTEIPSTPNTNTEKPRIDPYREIPE